MFTHYNKRNGAVMIVSYNGSIMERFEPPMPGFDDAQNNSCSGVILDLSSVEYINSIGVSSFLETFQYMKSRDINVILCSPNPQVFKVLKLARTELIVPIADSRSSASSMLYKLQEKTLVASRENILLVQASLDINTGLKTILKEATQDVNYNIVRALNPVRAWKILGGKSIQLIILDVTTPMKQGQQLLKQVRINRELKGIPFLIASDDKNLANAGYYTKNGADDILRFPFNEYETPVRIRTALSLYYNLQETQARMNEASSQQTYPDR